MAVNHRNFALRLAAPLAAMLLLAVPHANAAFTGYYALQNFTLVNNNADGSTDMAGLGIKLLLLGGNNGSGLPGTTDLTIRSGGSGFVSFDFQYLSFDSPLFDWAGYLVNGVFVPLADTDGEFGHASFGVSAGDVFGFRVGTADNTFYPGELYVSNFTAPVHTPEPGAGVLAFVGIAAIATSAALRHRKSGARALLVLFVAGGAAVAQQSQVFYSGTNVTGRLQAMRTVNVMQAAQIARLAPLGAQAPLIGPELRRKVPLLRPDSGPVARGAVIPPAAAPVSRTIAVVGAPPGAGFPGLTHYDQLNANRGNQYSVEPPNQSVAVANGYALVGVNNAVAVYSTAGAPLLPAVLSSNELFGLPPAIIRATGVNGPWPTDMRVFFDHTINRWFVLQRAQDYDVFGNPMNSSRIYMAVSQTADPLQNYTIYEIDTTNLDIQGCPCFSDYPQLGADQHGFYISVNEFNTLTSTFVTASILAISKAALAGSAPVPPVWKALVRPSAGYEFTIHPATTPPGASYFAAMGGLQYFVSTNFNANLDSSIGVWALYNTGSLSTANPQLTLVRTAVSTLRITSPQPVAQKPGPIPYGSSLGRSLSFIDGGDSRVLSVTYAGARLYVTAASQMLDDTSRSVVGAAYVVLAPTMRSGAFAASVVRQGYLCVRQNNLLRPAIAVNAQGKGAIAMTLVGPDYFPSAAFASVNGIPETGTLYLAAAGSAPQDGFSGYDDFFARWGDYSTATVAPDGSIWMIMQYIPDAPRTEFANWGTYVRRYNP